MGLREEINKKPGLTAGIVGGIVVLLLLFMYWEMAGGHPRAEGPGKAYYTADDGKTWFADDPGKITPFDHNGAQAVDCFVFKCSGSGPFAGYLETLTRDAHDAMLNPKGAPPGTSFGGTLVKKPGDKDWVLSTTPQGQRILNVQCPDGSGEKPQPVLP